MHQYATLEDTVYFWFGANDTAGSGADGATPVYDVRLGGAAADAAPVLSGSAALLSHANYPAGAHEVAIAATAANGFAAGNTYGVFCTLLVDAQNPTGFVGSFRLAPVSANAIQVGGTTQTGRDIGASVLLSPGTGAGQISLASGAVTVGTNNDKTGYTASTVGDKTGYSLAASQHVIVDSGTVTTLTNLPAVTSDWLTAAGVKADAVTKIQAGLATPTNITAASGVQLAASQHVIVDSGTVTTVSGDVGGKVLGGGAGSITGIGVQADVGSISGDATAADNLEAMLDGTGGVGLTLNRLVVNGEVDSGGVVDITNSSGTGFGIDINTINTAVNIVSIGNIGISCLADHNAAEFTSVLEQGMVIAGSERGLSIIGETDAAISIQNAGITGGAGVVVYAASGDAVTLTPGGTGVALNAANVATAAAVAAIATVLSGITNLAAWLRGLFRKDAMNATAKTEVNSGGGTYDETTDSNEAIRDRGDTAWGAGAVPSVEEIADGVWDELLSGHTDSGSAGEALSAAGTAGDPWIAALPGAYGAGSAGFIVGTRLLPGYWAGISITRDQGNTADRHEATWNKDFAAVATAITGATITVRKCGDGTLLINAAAMTQVGSTSSFRYDATGAERMTRGQSYDITVKATIDGAERTWGPVTRSRDT